MNQRERKRVPVQQLPKHTGRQERENESERDERRKKQDQRKLRFTEWRHRREEKILKYRARN